MIQALGGVEGILEHTLFKVDLIFQYNIILDLLFCIVEREFFFEILSCLYWLFFSVF